MNWGSQMELSWRTVTEAVVALCVTGMGWFLKRTVGRIDAHDERLNAIEITSAETTVAITQLTNACTEIKDGQVKNTDLIIKAITGK